MEILEIVLAALSLSIGALAYFVKLQVSELKEMSRNINKMSEVQVAHTTRLDNMDTRFGVNDIRLNDHGDRLRALELSHAACKNNQEK